MHKEQVDGMRIFRPVDAIGDVESVRLVPLERRQSVKSR